MGAGEPEAHQILHPGNGREGMRSRGTGSESRRSADRFQSNENEQQHQSHFRRQSEKDRREGRRQYSESRADDRNGIGFRNLLFREATNGCLPVFISWTTAGDRMKRPLCKNYGSVIALYKKSREFPAFFVFYTENPLICPAEPDRPDRASPYFCRRESSRCCRLRPTHIRLSPP